MGTLNGVANFSHSSFNNYATFANVPQMYRPSSVIISHSSGFIDISGMNNLIATHSSFEGSSFQAPDIDLSFSTLSNCNISGGSVDLSFSDITGSTVDSSGVYNGTHVQGAIINSGILSSKNVTGVPAQMPGGVDLLNGTFFGGSGFGFLDCPGANLSYGQIFGMELGGDYTSANFSYGKLGSTNHSWTTLSGIFSNANFSRVSFDQANIGIGSQNDAINRFSYANFSGADFTGMSAVGISYGDPSYMSNLVVWLENAGCNLDHAIIPGYPDGYGDVVTYDFASQADDLYTNLVQVQADYSNLSQDLLSTSNSLLTISSGANSVSNYVIDTEENWDYVLDGLSDSITYIENNAVTLSNDVSYLSNRVYETIQDLEPNLEVINNSNGVITLNMEMRSSGDLQNWQPIYSKDITITPTNNVRFYRFQSEQAKGQ